jgi:hypothetical protein
MASWLRRVRALLPEESRVLVLVLGVVVSLWAFVALASTMGVGTHAGVRRTGATGTSASRGSRAAPNGVRPRDSPRMRRRLATLADAAMMDWRTRWREIRRARAPRTQSTRRANG